MDISKRTILATVAMSACAPQPQSDADVKRQAELFGAAVNPTPEVNFEYGPKAAVEAASVAELFSQLGAPYEVYQVGDRTYYRWGAGRTATEGKTATVERNEFLVAADAQGKVIESKYLNKVRAVGSAGIVIVSDMP